MFPLQEKAVDSNVLADTVWVNDMYGKNEQQSVTSQIYQGLGVDAKGLSVDDQIDELGLNWEPETSPIRYGSMFEHVTEHSQVLYRPDDGQFMGVVSHDWYSENQSFRSILETFNNFCDRANLKLERVGTIQQSSKVGGVFGDSEQLKLKLWAVADLNQQFDLGQKDVVEGKLLLLCPYIYGFGYTVRLQAYRQVCTNGMHLPVRCEQKIISHNGQSTLNNIEKVLEGAKNCWKQLEETSQLLTQTPMTKEEAAVMLIAKFGDSTKPVTQQPKMVQMCIEQFSHGSFIGGDLLTAYNTAWGLLNTVTEFYNHHSVSKNPNTQINSLWVGNKAQAQIDFLQSISSFAYEKNKNNNKNVQTTSVRAF